MEKIYRLMSICFNVEEFTLLDKTDSNPIITCQCQDIHAKPANKILKSKKNKTKIY